MPRVLIIGMNSELPPDDEKFLAALFDFCLKTEPAITTAYNKACVPPKADER